MRDVVCEAKLFAKDKHKNHRDDDGLSYFDAHITQVVEILERVTRDIDVLAAAWLHDTLEDTDTSYGELLDRFGLSIATLVYEVTHEGKKDSEGYYFPRLKSKKAILIKFADRLSNLSRMDSWTLERQAHYLKKSKFWKDSL
jgi:guanosine-3',5'-bis(diphosphate) 3'-pyrophosphohydrolase